MLDPIYTGYSWLFSIIKSPCLIVPQVPVFGRPSRRWCGAQPLISFSYRISKNLNSYTLVGGFHQFWNHWMTAKNPCSNIWDVPRKIENWDSIDSIHHFPNSWDAKITGNSQRKVMDDLGLHNTSPCRPRLPPRRLRPLRKPTSPASRAGVAALVVEELGCCTGFILYGNCMESYGIVGNYGMFIDVRSYWLLDLYGFMMIYGMVIGFSIMQWSIKDGEFQDVPWISYW